MKLILNQDGKTIVKIADKGTWTFGPIKTEEQLLIESMQRTVFQLTHKINHLERSTWQKFKDYVSNLWFRLCEKEYDE